jgi:hypothetical protein
MPFSLKNQGRGQRQYRSRAHSLTGRSGLRRHTGEEKMALKWGSQGSLRPQPLNRCHVDMDRMGYLGRTRTASAQRIFLSAHA